MIRACDLKKAYFEIPRSKEIIKGIDLNLEKGTCVGLLGVNGAGKTTTFKMLAKQEPHTFGTLDISKVCFIKVSKYPYNCLKFIVFVTF